VALWLFNCAKTSGVEPLTKLLSSNLLRILA
jgi:hypothetical protein